MTKRPSLYGTKRHKGFQNKIRNSFRLYRNHAPIGFVRRSLFFGLPFLAGLLVLTVILVQFAAVRESEAVAFEKVPASQVSLLDPEDALLEQANLGLSRGTEPGLLAADTPASDEPELAPEAVTPDSDPADAEPVQAEPLQDEAALAMAPAAEAAPVAATTVPEVQPATTARPTAAPQKTKPATQAETTVPATAPDAPAETTAVPAETTAEPTAAATTPATQEAPAVKTVYVNAYSARIREAASTNSEIIGRAAQGDRLSLLSRQNGWAQVSLSNGIRGFISTELLSDSPVQAEFINLNATVYVNVQSANIRSEASADADRVGRSKYGDKLQQIRSNGTWSEVKTASGEQGYMRNDLFQKQAIVVATPTPVATAAPTAAPTTARPTTTEATFKSVNKAVYVRVGVANIRKSPSTGSDVIDTARSGEKLTQVSSDGAWSKIRTNDGSTGYMLNSLFQSTAISQPQPQPTTAPAATTAAPTTAKTTAAATKKPAETTAKATTAPTKKGNSGKINTVISAAKSMLGVRYVYGGESLAEGGFDCSGLMWHAYRQIGIRLPRSSRAQASAGFKISYSDLRPGDLVFFGSYGGSRIGHVGMYLGNDQYIHAPEPGKVVCIAKLPRNRLLAARRIVP